MYDLISNGIQLMLDIYTTIFFYIIYSFVSICWLERKFKFKSRDLNLNVRV